MTHEWSRKDLEAAVPNTSGTSQVSGLDATVRVFRDGYGIPHIWAESTEDAFFGQAFATTQDRLWYMDYFRRSAYGRWAEVVGSEGLDEDRLMRKFQIDRFVRSDYEALSGPARRMVEAYAAGVNAYIETADTLPVEYDIVNQNPEPWQPWDCIAVHKFRHVFMGKANTKLLRARLIALLGPEFAALLRRYDPEDRQSIVNSDVPYCASVSTGLRELTEGTAAIRWMLESEFGGSNSWALSGARTATGKPLMAGEAHRPPSTPNVYYQNHVRCPEFDVMGMSFAGCPGFPNIGHNGSVAWSVTNGETDGQDLYVEEFSREDPRQYRVEDRWERAEIRTESIQVSGSLPEDVEIASTRHGPLIWGDRTKGYGIAFKYPANAIPDTDMNCLLNMLLAKNADELDESFRDWVDPGNGFLHIDSAGGIGFLCRTKVPIRDQSNGWLPVAGSDSKHEWKGFIPFDDLPRARNPNSGYLVTANNRLVDESYPYYLSNDYAPPFRAQRVTDRIRTLEKASLDDVAAIHSEGTSIPARTLQRALKQIAPDDPLVQQARDLVLQWDRDMTRDSVPPAIYSALRLKLNLRIAEDILLKAGLPATENTGSHATDLTPPSDLVTLIATQVSLPLVKMMDEDAQDLLPTGTDWQKVLTDALTDAVAYLRVRLGDDLTSWSWGRLHRTHSPHTLSDAFPELSELLDPPSVAMGGDGEVPRSCGFLVNNPFVITGMPVARYVVDPSDWDNSGWVTPLGSSGHPGSKHYSDQQPLWANYELLPMTYTWDKVRATAATVQILEPCAD